MVRTILNEKVAQVYDNSPNGKPLGVWYTVKQNMLDYAAQQGVDICQLQRDLEAEYGIHEPYSVQARGEAHASEDILLQFTRKQLDFLAKALVAMAVVPVAEAQLRIVGTSGTKYVFQGRRYVLGDGWSCP